MMRRQSYEQLLQNLDGFIEVCRSMGLGELVDRGRVGDYRRRIQRLIGVVEARRRGEATPEIRAAIEAEQLHYLVALIEGTELGELVPLLQGGISSGVVDKLKYVLQGPPLSIEETPTSNRARNLLFELTMASKLRRAKVEPRLGEFPDISCEVDGKGFFIQCKRPFSERGLRDAIRDARRQLRRDLERAPAGTRGIIAISLSKALNPGDKLLIFSGEMEGRRGLEKAVADTAERCRSAWAKLAPKKEVVGVFFHIITAALDREADVYFVGQQLDVYPLSNAGTGDYRAFRALGSALDTIQY